MKVQKNILVTGGAGFIGSNIVDDLLKDGYNVTVFDNLSTGFRKNLPREVEFIQGDTSKVEELKNAFNKQYDVVLHIAGCASTISSFANPLSDIYANFIGTVNVVNQCLRFRIPRFLYASSMTVYGHPQILPIKEQHPTSPVSYYGITKYAAERFIHATSLRTDLQFPFNVTSFRMFNVYGERQSLTNPYQGVMAIFIGNLLRGEPVTIFGDGKQSRDFIYIKDVSTVWRNSIKNKNTYGQVYNLGRGEDISLTQLVKQIGNILGLKKNEIKIVYKNARPGDQRNVKADISAIKKVLDWSPEYDLAKGLKETLIWAQNSI